MGYLRQVRSAPPEAEREATCVAVYERELDYLFETLQRLGASPREIEDLAHEVFLVLLRNWADLDLSRPFRPYLFAVAFRVVCAHRRRRRREVPYAYLDAEDQASRPRGIASVQGIDAAPDCRARHRPTPAPSRRGHARSRRGFDRRGRGQVVAHAVRRLRETAQGAEGVGVSVAASVEGRGQAMKLGESGAGAGSRGGHRAKGGRFGLRPTWSARGCSPARARPSPPRALRSTPLPAVSTPSAWRGRRIAVAASVLLVFATAGAAAALYARVARAPEVAPTIPGSGDARGSRFGAQSGDLQAPEPVPSAKSQRPHRSSRAAGIVRRRAPAAPAGAVRVRQP